MSNNIDRTADAGLPPQARPIAILDNCRAPVSDTRNVTFQKLARGFAAPKLGKKDGPAWMPARIEPGPRTSERVGPISFLVLDVEADAQSIKGTDGNPQTDSHGDAIKRVVGPEPPSVDDMVAELRLWGWDCILHTTYSHGGAILPEGIEHPRYRLIFNLSRLLAPADLKTLGLHVAGQLGIADCIDTNALEPARLYYLPRCPTEERLRLYRHAVLDGEPLDVDDMLAEASKIEAAQKAALSPQHGKQTGGVIQAFNDAHDPGMILEANGYVKKGRNRWLWPGSTTGMPGVRVVPDSTPPRIYSSHDGDPLADGHAHDAFDVLRILKHGGDTKAAVREAAKALRPPVASASAPAKGEHQPGNGNAPAGDAEGNGWPEPTPLPDSLLSVDSFDYAMLPDNLTPWVRDTCERVQCAPDFVAAAVMAGAGSIVGRKIGIRPQARTDWTVTPNQWALAVGRPGVLKSPALEAALSPIKRLAAVATDIYTSDMEQYRIATRTAKLRAEEGEKSARKLLAKTRDADVSHLLNTEEPEEPILRRYIAVDSNAASLGELHRQNHNGLLVHRDEMVSLLRSLDREDQAEARGFYLTAWNGDSSYTFDRIGRGLNLHIPAVCLSLLGSTQPGRIAEYIRHAVRGGAGDDGLIQRFGLLVWPDTCGEWRDIDRWPDSAAKNEAHRVFDYLDKLDPAAIGAQQDTSHTGEPEGIPYLRFDDAAHGMFLEWRTDLEARLRGGDLHPALESHLAKYRKLVPSLALILHLADNGTGPVTEGATLKALAWAEYLETHARRAYGSVTGPEVATAKAIISRIRKGDLKREFSSREVWRPGWAGLTDREQVADALRLLVDFDWLSAEIRSDTGGRPATIFIANPRGFA